MKAKPIIFSGMAILALCLATPGHLRADGTASQPGTVQYISPNANSSMTSSQSGAVMTNQNQLPTRVNKAKKLIGMNVRNPNNQKLGKVKDVVLNLQSGRIDYVVLKKAGRTHGTGKYVSLPPNVFTPSANNRYLILNADKNRLQNTYGFSKGNYPPMSNAVYGAQPAVEHEHIIIVPVPSSSDQDQDRDLNPDLDHEQNTTPDTGFDISSL